jgi:hypothetical protein
MDRVQLLAEVGAAAIGPQDVVFLGRWGDDYRWGTGIQLPLPGPDAWIFYSGPWPSGPPDDLSRFLEDLLAEMESMCGGADRCRWPLDQPYPAH